MDTMSEEKQLQNNLLNVGCNMETEQLKKVFEDPELSRTFFTILLFALSTGKTFEEVMDGIAKTCGWGEAVCMDTESQDKDGAREDNNNSD